MKPSALGLSLQGGGGFQGMFKLIVISDAVEGVGAIVLQAESGVPLNIQVRVAVSSLIEGLPRLVVGIETPGLTTRIAVASQTGARQTLAEAAAGHVSSRACRQIAVASPLDAGRRAGALPGRGSSGHDVDGSHERRRSVDSCCRTFEHFDVVDVGLVDRIVEGVVPRLRVADVDAVEQHGNLLAASSADTDVGEGSHRAFLSDVGSCHEFQHVVNTLYRCRLNLVAAQYSDHSRLLTLGQRRSRSPHFHHLQLSCGGHHCGVGTGLVGVGADTGSLGVGQCGNTQGTHKHFAAEHTEERVALVAEPFELEGLAPDHEWFVHTKKIIR